MAAPGLADVLAQRRRSAPVRTAASTRYLRRYLRARGVPGQSSAACEGVRAGGYQAWRCFLRPQGDQRYTASWHKGDRRTYERGRNDCLRPPGDSSRGVGGTLWRLAGIRTAGQPFARPDSLFTATRATLATIAAYRFWRGDLLSAERGGGLRCTCYGGRCDIAALNCGVSRWHGPREGRGNGV